MVSPGELLIWTRARKTAFANAPMECGPHMVSCTAKPRIGLQPNGSLGDIDGSPCRQPDPKKNLRRSQFEGRQNGREGWLATLISPQMPAPFSGDHTRGGD